MSKQGLVPILVCLCIFLSQKLYAGLIDHTVTIDNQSGGKVSITILTFAGDSKFAGSIANGNKYTFHFGKTCPNTLDGSVEMESYWYPYKTFHDIKRRCFRSGDETNGTCDNIFPSCKSSTWSVVKHSDGSFHFSKN